MQFIDLKTHSARLKSEIDARVQGVLDALPVAERLSGLVLSLPMHPYLADQEVDQVSAALIAALTPNC